VIGDILKSLRKRAGASQSEIAAKMGVSRERVKNLEASNNAVLSVLKDYLDACGTRLSFGIFDNAGNYAATLGLESIKESLSELRKKRSLTQAGLSCAMGLSRSRVEQIENGTENIKLDTLYKYIKGCGLELRLAIKPLTSGNASPPL